MGIVVVTGHRDCFADHDDIVQYYNRRKDWIFMHGGCKEGFDEQVDKYLRARNHAFIEICRPNYKNPHASLPTTAWVKIAPLIRNEAMIREAIFNHEQLEVLALYDGRTSGGTWHTVTYASLWRLKIVVLKPVR